MAQPASDDRVHVLEIPLTRFSLVLPSASVAEVVTIGVLTPVPFAPPWMLGVIGWRTVAVPVVSFDALVGVQSVPPTSHSKAVVLYPLASRANWEFFSVVVTAEPRPRTINRADMVMASPSDLPASPYLATGFRLENRLFAIPDLAALKTVFYP